MRKKVFVLALVIVIVLSCVLMFTACNNGSDSKSPLDVEDGTRPDYASLFTADDIALINRAMAEDASDEDKQQAVITMYNAANKSRKETPLSLMIQNSDVGIQPTSLGVATMHAFNLRQGDSWYYQLVTEIDSLVDFAMSSFAGILKVGYTLGDGDYYYTLYIGDKAEMSCSIDTFPYSSFKLVSEVKPYTEEQFKEELHYLDSMHEINNMAFCAEIIDPYSVEIEYNSEDGFYTVDFEIDMLADDELLEAWFDMPNKDMQVSGNSIQYYKSYTATLQVWDNGYAKYFISHADRVADGMASGTPVDEFKYFWNEDEIMALLEQDASVTLDVEEGEATPLDYIMYYSGKETVKGKLLSDWQIIVIVVACVVAAVIITVIVIEVLVRTGKLPKLAARRAAKKEKRIAKRAAKNGESLDRTNDENTPDDGDII